MTPILVENLVIEYKRAFRKPIRAVNSLSFQVGKAEIVGFLGVNGAGKTSTIKGLMGFQPLTSGAIQIFDLPVGNVEARSKIGFLPETATYSPYLTPFETLRLYGQLNGLSGKTLRHRIEALLEEVGISDRARTLNRQLSKGMLQRVGIAQALLCEPRLLIMDEMSSGLDPVGRRDLRDLMQRQRSNGVTVFFSSHDISEVESLCDRILVIHQGRLIAERTVSELRGRVRSVEDYFIAMVQSGVDPLCEAAA